MIPNGSDGCIHVKQKGAFCDEMADFGGILTACLWGESGRGCPFRGVESTIQTGVIWISGFGRVRKRYSVWSALASYWSAACVAETAQPPLVLEVVQVCVRSVEK